MQEQQQQRQGKASKGGCARERAKKEQITELVELAETRQPGATKKAKQTETKAGAEVETIRRTATKTEPEKSLKPTEKGRITNSVSHKTDGYSLETRHYSIVMATAGPE